VRHLRGESDYRRAIGRDSNSDGNSTRDMAENDIPSRLSFEKVIDSLRHTQHTAAHCSTLHAHTRDQACCGASA